MRTQPTPTRGAVATAALALALLPCAVHAATMGTIPVDPAGGVVGAFAAPGTQTWTLDLQRGRYYAVSSRGDCPSSVAARGAGGGIVASFTTPGDDATDGPSGVSFRAPYTGSYTVEVTVSPGQFADFCWPSTVYFLWAARDCPGDASTRCAIAVGATLLNLRLDYQTDADWFRTTLAAGHSYRASTTGKSECADLVVIGAGGKPLAEDDCSSGAEDQTLAFTAPASGTYLVAVRTGPDLLPTSYSLSLVPAR